ncbi:MAG: type II toxin-antitoxin system death-on-curing family toxin [Candidatus Harrisonbacteria bacterium]|nr:type II toxin-antitoxin system death-on-curing family toxin [Candidatus Harrisonbacteria bacterium]
MKYLSGEEILVIHSEIIDRTGGSHGIRDAGLLVSIVEKAKMSFGGKELYQGVFNKAAAYLESLARYHIFIDGNKRIGIGASARFLFLNGLELTATNKEVENFVLEVVDKKFDLETIASWFKKHSRKIQ